MFMGFFFCVSAMKVMVTAVQTPSPLTRSPLQDKGQWLARHFTLLMFFIYELCYSYFCGTSLWTCLYFLNLSNIYLFFRASGHLL